MDSPVECLSAFGRPVVWTSVHTNSCQVGLQVCQETDAWTKVHATMLGVQAASIYRAIEGKRRLWHVLHSRC